MTNYQMAPPTPPPTNGKSKWFSIVIVTMVFFMFTWHFGAKPLYEDFKDKWITIESSDGCNADIGKNLLHPGYHVFAAPPFVTFIPVGMAGIIEKNWWGYAVHKFDNIRIPNGHVGVVTGCEGVLPDPLMPGIYRLNRMEYNIELVNTQKQTYVFGVDNRNVYIPGSGITSGGHSKGGE